MQTSPSIYGLVLAGGKSTRMGRDKCALRWHGKEQQYHIADLLGNLTEETFISRRKDQVQPMEAGYRCVQDSFTGIGPYGGILSAFTYRPQQAWFTVACDLPLLDMASLQFLLDNRQPEALATTFISPVDKLPEPLVTIWEPKSFPVLLAYRELGFTCPRKVLIRSGGAHMLLPPNPDALINVNTPEDFVRAQRILNQPQSPEHAR